MTWESEGRSGLVRCYRHITTDTSIEEFFQRMCSFLDIHAYEQHRTILILKIKLRMIIGCHLDCYTW